MKIYKLIFASFLALTMLVSCEKYEEYVNDFDYTTTYFGTQKPLRTIVARDEMQFEVGVALGGMRTDDGSHSVDFEVDPSLLDDIPEASGLVVLPAEYYTLGSASNFNIVKDHMRTVSVTLNKDAFTADPLSLTNTYALPLRITSATVDSISGSELEVPTILSKDITILVVKYISQYSGYYYSKGVQYTLGTDGNPTDTTSFYNENLSQNAVKQFTTKTANTVSAANFGADISGNMDLTVNSDNSVVLASSDVVINSYDCTYVEDETTFYLNVNLTKSGTTYEVQETLILRQAPELDLRFEEW